MAIEIGEKIPDLTLTDSQGNTFKFSDYNNQNIVLYFYPKDNTPGCTREGIDFRDQFATFQKKNTVIFGVSRDKPSSHDKFKCKYEFPFELIADTDSLLCRHFDVLKLKNFFLKKVNMVERSTFLFDEKHQLIKVWRKVKVNGHVEEVLKAL